MILSSETYSQNSVEITGASANYSNSQFKMSGLENSVSNFASVKDWEFSAAYSTEFGSQSTSNLYLISLSKRIRQHYFHLRYTPGYQKDFLLRTGYSIISYDSVPVNLQSKIHYEEKFGFGYSFRLNERITTGLSLRYFQEEFTDDKVTPVYSDTLTTIITSTERRIYNRWRGDLGITYIPKENIVLSLSTVNLLADELSNASNNDLLLKTKKTLLGTLDYQITDFLKTKINYETNNSFSLGLNFGIGINDANLNFSADVFHDKYQNPLIAGVIPAINYSTQFYSVTLSGIKYFSDRTRNFEVNDFISGGIYNLTNNRFSTDRAALTVNFALNTTRDKIIKFEDVKIEKNIFPALSEQYLVSPFASASVINLTLKPVTVLPSSKIAGLNNETIQSPAVVVQALDTAEVMFYTSFDGVKNKLKYAEISQTDFYISVDVDEIQDELQRPVLIHDINSWDGNISNLRYFVKKDFNVSNARAKQCLSNYKSSLDTIPSALNAFYITQIIYDNFISDMIYVADPRSSADRVQYPAETFSLKGGDCDDLSVAFSSLLESVGIQTAFIDYKSDSSISHVNLLVNTQLQPDMAGHITVNDKKYFVRKNPLGKDEIWIPIETTILKSFNDAWETGSDLFYTEAIDKYGLAKGSVHIVDIY